MGKVALTLLCAFVIVSFTKNAFGQSISTSSETNLLIHKSSEKLYFLASSDRSFFDYQVANPFVAFGSTQQNGEWYCRYMSGGEDGELVAFRDSVDLEYFREASGARTDRVSNHPGELVIDFIYRLEGGEVLHSEAKGSSLQSDTSAAFEIQASLRSADDSLTSIARAFGWQDYATNHPHPHELRSLTFFPTRNTSRYALLSMRLPLPNGSAKRGTLTLRLISKHRCGIYVRGFRVRTPIADEILKGSFDRSFLTKQSESAAPTVLPTSERTLPHFRAIAYLDFLQFKKTGWHPFGHLIESADRMAYFRYRAIYEDQNGIPPDYERP